MIQIQSVPWDQNKVLEFQQWLAQPPCQWFRTALRAAMARKEIEMVEAVTTIANLEAANKRLSDLRMDYAVFETCLDLMNGGANLPLEDIILTNP